MNRILPYHLLSLRTNHLRTCQWNSSLNSLQIFWYRRFSERLLPDPFTPDLRGPPLPSIPCQRDSAILSQCANKSRPLYPIASPCALACMNPSPLAVRQVNAEQHTNTSHFSPWPLDSLILVQRPLYMLSPTEQEDKKYPNSVSKCHIKECPSVAQALFI